MFDGVDDQARCSGDGGRRKNVLNLRFEKGELESMEVA